jgi:Txe/YoeB family toxin of toxin-antitoxin system
MRRQGCDERERDRRRGRVEPRALWVAASFTLFLVVAWALVLLPFPNDIAKYCATNAPKIQLVPFHWLSETIRETQREPFTGIGKPEPLRENLTGYWSRRIDDTNRLVYAVEEQAIIVVACRYHY